MIQLDKFNFENIRYCITLTVLLSVTLVAMTPHNLKSMTMSKHKGARNIIVLSDQIQLASCLVSEIYFP